MNEIQTFTLSNGIRVVHSPSPTQIAYIGIAVDAGTRDELSHESGMAHFAEHMSFKGTTKRSALNIINCMESVGGDLNAFTGKEETVYYCTTPLAHWQRAIRLLLDITLSSTYMQREMDKEVEVVIDEIESYNDTPSELIFDDFENIIFGGHALGRNILGDATLLRQHTHDTMQQFIHRLYLPQRMVLFVYGQVDILRLQTFAERYLQNFSPIAAPHPITRTAPTGQRTEQNIHRSKDTHQTHVMLGTRCCGQKHEDHLPLFVLNNILGGPGMNARLNLALRERNALVYTAESSLLSYTDTGTWSAYFGCDHHDLKRCLRLVRRELQRLTDAPLTEKQLNAAKQQLKGQLLVSQDNFESVAIGMGKRMLHHNTLQPISDLFTRIDALTPQCLQDVAQRTFAPATLTTLVYE